PPTAAPNAVEFPPTQKHEAAAAVHLQHLHNSVPAVVHGDGVAVGAKLLAARHPRGQTRTDSDIDLVDPWPCARSADFNLGSIWPGPDQHRVGHVAGISHGRAGQPLWAAIR